MCSDTIEYLFGLTYICGLSLKLLVALILILSLIENLVSYSIALCPCSTYQISGNGSVK